MMAALATSTIGNTAPAAEVPHVVLAIHGGAGVTPKNELDPALEKELRKALDEALQAGGAALKKPNATSLDAVEAAIRVLEDSPYYNAGRGAAFTRDGKNEMDASLMDGRTRAAGAVASVTTIKNPITAARAVMEKSGHVIMVGDGAEKFAKECGCEIVDPKYFWTEARWKDLQDRLKKEQEKSGKSSSLRADGAADLTASGAVHAVDKAELKAAWRFGTVGAVAVDSAGNLAAGTSTGGLTMKRHGRVGDSPILGAGTYADNHSCAVSATGDGEYFIRAVAAHDIASLVEYKGLSLSAAADEVIHKKIKSAGGDGAVIVLDAKGNYTASFNTEGLHRGYLTSDGQRHVAIYKE
jgi:beta-aspartyl-peptidase (threonine type)